MRPLQTAAEKRLTDSIEDALLRVEREINLLHHLSPINLELELPRAIARFQAGRWEEPRLAYPARSDLYRARRTLESAAVALAQMRDYLPADLLVERLAELDLEAQLVEARGSRTVCRLTRARYEFVPRDVAAADALTKQWLTGTDDEVAADVSALPSGRSALDEEAEVALAPFLLELCRKAELEVPVVERATVARACINERELMVRTGCRVSKREARRIFYHELYAHYLPRQAAKAYGAPYRIGTRGSNEDEEGRAILIEERQRFLGAARKRELAMRHRASTRIRDEVSHLDVALELVRDGQRPEEVLPIVLRAARGGGLAREYCYLPAYVRVKRRLTAQPELERLVERGRISVEAAQRLAGSHAASPTLSP